MGHGDRPAARDLGREQRDHRTARSQHIAKAHGHVLGCRELRRHALHHQFGHALGRAHHVGRVDRLVGGNHDEALRPALTRHPRRMQGTQHVGTQGLDLVEFLHQRHVLVGRRMENYRRFVRLGDRLQPGRLAHVGRVVNALHLRMRRAKLLLQLVDRVFGHIHADQARNTKAGNLPAQLRADGTTSAGDEHGLARYHFRKTLDVKLHWVATQQVFEFDFARTGPLLPQPFIGPWQRHERQSRLG